MWRSNESSGQSAVSRWDRASPPGVPGSRGAGRAGRDRGALPGAAGAGLSGWIGPAGWIGYPLGAQIHPAGHFHPVICGPWGGRGTGAGGESRSREDGGSGVAGVAAASPAAGGRRPRGHHGAHGGPWSQAGRTCPGYLAGALAPSPRGLCAASRGWPHRPAVPAATGHTDPPDTPLAAGMAACVMAELILRHARHQSEQVTLITRRRAWLAGWVWVLTKSALSGRAPHSLNSRPLGR